jgi:8-oxo-dGTP diphosphatase
VEKIPLLKVVCAIIEHEGKVLVTQRGPQMKLPGKWEFPGGKVHAGESESEALLREIKEELALEIEVLERLTPVHATQPEFILQLIPFRCLLTGGALTLAEHQDFRWASAVELSDFDWCPADQPIVQEWQNQ